MKRGGFTLVEILVALVVLAVGLLGVVGTLLLAARTMTRADALERGVGAVEIVLDSLRSGGASGVGVQPWEAGDVWWRLGDGGAVEARVSGAGDSALIQVWGRLPPPGRAEP